MKRPAKAPAANVGQSHLTADPQHPTQTLGQTWPRELPYSRVRGGWGGGSNLCKDFTPPPQAEPTQFRALVSCSLEIRSLACTPTESHKKEQLFLFNSINRKKKLTKNWFRLMLK